MTALALLLVGAVLVVLASRRPPHSSWTPRFPEMDPPARRVTFVPLEVRVWKEVAPDLWRRVS